MYNTLDLIDECIERRALSGACDAGICECCDGVNAMGLACWCACGHPEDPNDMQSIPWELASGHEYLLPAVCGTADPFSEMAGMHGPGHTIYCGNAPIEEEPDGQD